MFPLKILLSFPSCGTTGDELRFRKNERAVASTNFPFRCSEEAVVLHEEGKGLVVASLPSMKK